MDYGRIKPRLTVRAVVMFENMTGVRINDAGRSADPELAAKLLYCCLAAGGLDMPYEKALPLLAGPAGERWTEQLADENEMDRQFAPPADDNGSDETDGSDARSDAGGSNAKTESEPWTRDIVPVLVKDCGSDIQYVMDNMKYTDIPVFLRYREQRMRAETEDKRLWVYLITAPHLNPKKRVTPESFLPLPWEKEKKIVEFKKNSAAMTEKLREFGIIKDKKEEDGKDGNGDDGQKKDVVNK